ncbi:MAG: hypothetical protein ACK5NA_06825 [Enterococcus sp.]
MENIRILNKDEDYKRLGINHNHIEEWEHGRRRNPEEIPAMENWYFDSIMNDGTKVVVVFMTKTGDKRNLPLDSPNVRIQITSPSGELFEDAFYLSTEESETRFGECYVKYGPHSFIGNLIDCDIIVKPENGIGCNLHLHGLTKPFRPGTGYIAFGDDEVKEYTWLTFPRCEVNGTITYNGQTQDVQGTGYHDHQFHNIDSMSIIHHWFWGRASLGEYTVAMFDIVANEKYGFQQIPIFCVMDKSGEVIFDGTEHGNAHIKELYWSKKAQKFFPKTIIFNYERDGKKVEFTVTWKQELEVRTPETIFGKLDSKMALTLSKQGLDPSYIRYKADASLKIKDRDNTLTVSGDMIYEYAYFGKHDSRAHIELTD